MNSFLLDVHYTPIDRAIELVESNPFLLLAPIGLIIGAVIVIVNIAKKN